MISLIILKEIHCGRLWIKHYNTKKQLGEADLKKKKKRSMKSETQISQVK